MKWFSAILLFFLISFRTLAQDPLGSAPTIDTNPANSPANVWVTDGMAKVFQNSGSPGAAKWLQLYAAKNETISFQVHVQAPATGIANLNVTVTNLVNSATGTDYITPASTDIVVYAEHYMCTDIPTAKSGSYYGVTGCIPDVLVPAQDPYHHQTTNAFPIKVTAGKNQSVWIDVHIPSTTPSGYYSGAVFMSDGGVVFASIPVVIGVWNWTMPSTSSVQTVISSYTNSSFGDLQVQLLDNRYSLNRGASIDPGAGSFTSFDAAYGPLLSGTATGILHGAKLSAWIINSNATASVFSNYKTHFASKGWVAPWFYLSDEPSSKSDWSAINSGGSKNHTFTSPVIPNLVTTNYADANSNNALNNIDVMVAKTTDLEPQGGPLQNLSNYQKWLTGSSSRIFGSYISCSESGTCSNGQVGSGRTHPNYNVDGLPVANRVMEWLSFKHGQTMELYWGVDWCNANPAPTQANGGGCGNTTHPNNALLNNYSYGGWGDGTLMYYGSSAFGVSTPIWVPSIRMKLIRDGMQDYEYLAAVTNAGGSATAQSAINSFITNSYTYNMDPAGLTAARITLGKFLHAQSLVGVPNPPPPPPPTTVVAPSNIGVSVAP